MKTFHVSCKGQKELIKIKADSFSVNTSVVIFISGGIWVALFPIADLIGIVDQSSLIL